MIALPLLAAIVALAAGHPVPVTCDAPVGLLGTTMMAQPFPVQLSPYVCNTWREARGARGVPSEEWMAALGQDLLAAVHEGEHVRYGSNDEAMTECRALRDLPAITSDVLGTQGGDALGRWLVQQWTGQVLAYAHYLDAGLPPQYHGATC